MKNQYVPWVLAAVVWGVISYLYHPSLPTMIAGTIIGVGLSGLIYWSASKIVDGKWWWLKVLVVSTVAGLMNSTALDVAYSLTSAPEGNRFIVGIEMIASGLVLTLLAIAKTTPWAKK